MESELVLLDEKNKIVSRVKAGNPLDWQNTSALEIHNINAKLELPNKKGSYKVALYLHNSAGTGAYLANDIKQTDGYNILYTIEL